ncbi:MAG: DNA gyrase inhibitor YacG [Planctomycetota bacterium]|nr:DNA gyrase inhibitor YacG [Blastopirellula sp.]
MGGTRNMLHESARCSERAEVEASGKVERNEMEASEVETSKSQANGSGLAGEPSTGSGASVRRRCALCGKFYLVTDSRLVPFCSERCQQVDLGNWLGEAYGLPWEDPAGGDSLPGTDDDD